MDGLTAPRFPARAAARDAALLALVWLAWGRIDGASDAYQLGLAVGTVAIAFVGHEWGHWVGGRIAGARLDPSRSVLSPFLFRFARSNSTRQFVIMSLGGFVASAVAVALLVMLLPSDTFATRVTHVLVALGVLATFVLEVPELVRVVRSGRFPEGFAYVDLDPA